MIVPHLEAVPANQAERCEWFENCIIMDAVHLDTNLYVGFDIQMAFNTTNHELATASIIANDAIHFMIHSVKNWDQSGD